MVEGGRLGVNERRDVAENLPRLENTGEVCIGEYRFQRLALGAMRLLSSDAEFEGRTVECFADPKDPEANCALIHAAVRECGIGYIDFARGYGARPGAGERWFRRWMEPYPEDVLWATKVGYERDAQGGWILNLAPEFMRREIELSLELLGRPIPLCYLTAGSTQDVTIRHRQASVMESFQPLLDSHERGELLHLGVANVTADELKQLLDVAPISVVQNKFTVASLAQPAQREVLELCRSRGIPFVAWGVFQSDDESPWSPGADLVETAKELSISPQEASIALLLHASPNLVVLTGVSRPQSLASSVRAANLAIPAEILSRFRPDLG
jgi:pyridoxine 4-dehydrogenase